MRATLDRGPETPPLRTAPAETSRTAPPGLADTEPCSRPCSWAQYLQAQPRGPRPPTPRLAPQPIRLPQARGAAARTDLLHPQGKPQETAQGRGNPEDLAALGKVGRRQKRLENVRHEGPTHPQLRGPGPDSAPRSPLPGSRRPPPPAAPPWGRPVALARRDNVSSAAREERYVCSRPTALKSRVTVSQRGLREWGKSRVPETLQCRSNEPKPAGSSGPCACASLCA